MLRLALYFFCLASLTISLGISTSWSDFEDSHIVTVSFLHPNEDHPIWQKEILEQAPVGVHIAVGTDRGFMGLALNPNATALVLIDEDSSVVRFNEINVAFLKLAQTRRDYLKLRFASNYSGWQNAGLKLSQSDWNFWQTQVIHNGKFKDFNDPKSPLFKDANYMYSAELFDKVSSFAKENKIIISQVDLTSTKQVRSLINRLIIKDMDLGVLDISNAWQKQYMNTENLSNMLKEFSSWAKPKSTWMITRPDISNKTEQPFVYEGYTFRHLNNPTAVARALQANEYRRDLPKAALDPKASIKEFEPKSFLTCFIERFRR
jgi:hypothetical protein